MKQLITVVGARPQFIKASVVSRALKNEGIGEIIIHTGQHYDENMSGIFWQELQLKTPEVNLNIGSATHGAQTAECLTKLEIYLLDKRSDIKALMVYGDTNSTLAGALAATKLNIPVIHVEAGLRSFNRNMPEEINRILTDHTADLLFCSSEKGVKQLRQEGIEKNVYNTGDVMQDALNTFADIAQDKYTLKNIIPFKTGSYNLVTIHRPTNTDSTERLRELINTLGKLDKPVVWPVHPRNRNKLEDLDLPDTLFTLPPVSYFEMLLLLHNAHKVLTDSGGLQKEAYWMKKPCITLRNETEWTETLQNGWNRLAGAETQKIIQAYESNPVEPWRPLYGSGDTSSQIATIIKNTFFKN